MTDVTNDIVCTDGAYHLQDGDSVDLIELWKIISGWLSSHPGTVSMTPMLVLFLLSHGVKVELFVCSRQGQHADESSVQLSQDGSEIVANVEASYLMWRGQDQIIGAESTVDVLVPRILTTDFVLFESDYGKSHLTGLALEYYNVQHHEKLSAR